MVSFFPANKEPNIIICNCGEKPWATCVNSLMGNQQYLKFLNKYKNVHNNYDNKNNNEEDMKERRREKGKGKALEHDQESDEDDSNNNNNFSKKKIIIGTKICASCWM
jgi:hypothetical protein